jgi:type IV pilus assembly protein PilY1
MFRSLTKRIFYTAFTFSLALSTQTGRADDTEIYFSGGDVSGGSSNVIRPNVLFILDTSGSMDNDLSGDPDGRSRIEVLREAMAEIIADIQNVNLGLMRFTYNDGGPVLFPITYIDETLDNVVGAVIDDGTTVTFDFERIASEDAEEDILSGSATEGTVVTNNPDGFDISRVAAAASYVTSGDEEDLDLRILNDDADAEEDTDDGTNNMSSSGFGLDSSTLKVDPDNMVALRYTFTQGTIPECTEITDANLRLRTRDDDSGSQVIKVWGQDSDSTVAFTETHQGLSSRPDTSAVVLWDPPGFDDDEWYDLDDGVYSGGDTTRLEDVLEEIVNRGCSGTGTGDGTWDGESIVLFMEQHSGSNDRDFYSRDQTSWKAPRLLITLTGSGETIPAVAASQNLVAVRFEDIDIPNGADISSASLKFHPSTDAGSNGDNVFRIYGEDVDDSPAFATTASHLSGRKTANSTTNYARWTVPAWTEDDVIETTNTHPVQTLESVLTEITSRTDWCGGNDITLFIEAETDGDLRFADSLETQNDAFTLEFGYDSSITDGCFQDETSKQLEVSQDDAQQDGTNANADVNESSIPISNQTSGFRFSGVSVPAGATIINASIEFISSGATTGSTDVSVSGELPDDADADEFQYAIDNITDRLVGDTAAITWSLPATLSANESFDTAELKTIVQAMVNDTDWASGQAMVFLFDPVTDGTHSVWARDGDATKGANLTITYESSGTVVTKTARERMVELVEALPSSDHTPILDTLYEAAHYWRGESIVFGKDRWGDDDSALSHPGSYCSDNGDGTYDCNGATIDGDTNEFGVDYEGTCDPDNQSEWESSTCDNTYIKGSPSYISPFDSASTCQKNYQIFLTDGSMYDSDGESATEIDNEYISGSCLANNSSFKSADDDSITYDSSGDHVQKCAVDLAQYLNETDQIADNILANDQTVQTSTVAFDLSGSAAQYMKDIANLGGGDFYEANSATDLVNIFQSFLSDVRNVPTSFVAPSLATNAFNRLLSRDEVYFGLFTPELDERWLGNVKKYNICIDTTDFGGCTAGNIFDADSNAAINATTNRFDDDARSEWTDASIEDGGETVVGGAGAEVTKYADPANEPAVTLYTEVGGDSAGGTLITSGTTLNTAGYVYTESATTSDDWAHDDLEAIRAKVCDPAPPSPVNTGHADAPDCEDRMKWLLGKKIVGEPDSDISANQRWSSNDVLHSSPIVITYGGEDTTSDGSIDTFYDKLVFGTNDGALHMINGIDGTEDWRFIPNTFMSQQRDMFDNPEGTHKYGMDVTPLIRVVDHNGNGVLERPDAGSNNDIAYIYQATRRGGNLLYALDVSDELSSATESVEPKYLWKIEGGSGDFTRLGDTWSRPAIADIQTTTGTKTVLIFGGGYDDNLDASDSFGTTATSGNDNMGNAIYIIDADTGAKILSIAGNSTAGTDADIEITNMKFSIPSRITIVDSSQDGIDDRLYVGDTGGQVWRVDLGNDILAAGGITAAATCDADSTCDKTVVGRLALISDGTVDADKRRFFEPPSVVQVLDTEFADTIGQEYDYVLLGTGYRAHPLNEDVSDRFYAFRDIEIDGMTATAGTHIAANYPKTSSVSIGHSVANELINITTQTLQDAVDASIDVGASLGWYFDFDESNTVSGVLTEAGEKVLSAAVSIAGAVFFTTYVPTEDSSTDVCVGAQIGGGRAYNFDILDTKAAIDWEGDDDDITGRKKSLGGGIPSDVVPVFTKEGVVGIVGVEGGATQLGSLSGLPRLRTYYYEES